MQDPWGVGTGKDATPAKGFFKNVLAKSAQPTRQTSPALGRSPRGPAALKPAGTVGLLQGGNIDLNKRPVVQNKNGTYSTVRSITITDENGRATLIPTVVGNRVVSNQQAIRHYQRTGQHLGQFDSESDADAYAQTLHEAQAKQYAPPLPKATVAPRTSSRGHRGVTDLQPSETAGQVLHSIVNFLGSSPTAILHNAAVIGSNTLPPQAGVQPRPATDIKASGVPLFGPGAVGHVGALGILPFKGLLGRAATDVAQHEASSLAPKVAAKVARGRTAQEAAKHIKDARSFWAEKMPTPALETAALKPGEITAETGGPAGAVVREAFTTGEQTVAEARKATAELQSVERGKRFAEGEAARAKAGGGTAGQIASLRAQKGELGFVPHAGLAGKPAPVVEAMIRHVENLPSLREGERLTTIESLRNWWTKGKPPTDQEQAFIEHAFGKNVAEAIAKDPGFKSRVARLNGMASRIGQESLLLPRAFKAALDFSAAFRQNLLPTISHPIENAKLLPSAVKSAFSEGHFQGSQANILSDPNFPLHWAAKVPFTDIGHSGAEGVGNLAAREELFASNLAERMNLRELPGLEGLGKLGTGPGDLVRASDRGYVGLLNQSRQKVSNRLIQKAALAGEDLTDPKVIKAIGSATGALTGRGSLGPWLERHAVSLNALLFSPRFAASRFNLLGFGGKDLVEHGFSGALPGSYYANLYRASPTAAKEVAASMRNLAIVAGSVLYAAHKAGALVSNDPTNADFAKIRVGNTRVDILAGLQSPVRAAAQEILQKETSSQTGKVTHLGGSSFNALGRLDPAWKFISAKASPVPGLALQQMGLTQKAQSHKAGSIIQNLLEPFSIQDSIAQYQGTHSVPAGALALLLSGTGFGIQNYKSPQPKTKSTDPWGSSGGGSGGGGGSAPWGP